ncbi:sugar kinase [Paenibacillus xerothermodurans]|uniref:Sugar kinase n=1 Tax=Paenibacillus xerothermodurans TaxID=1977292 RepID=A0A2W1NPM2_PAEXE|nr:sugar kinase [Paenibacillus xerothermodurans]PZE20853.1 sugar kinase [Paenibacillus xerothermodurans]
MTDPQIATGQMFRPDIITFGETMALMIPTSSKGIEYSAEFQSMFGGAESNFAIGISRLGHRVGWFSRLGKDPLGQMILKKIRGEGVDVSRVELTTDAPTGLMLRQIVSGKTSVFYYRKGSAASTMRPDQLDEEYIRQAKYLHVTGVTPALSDSCRATVKEAIRIAHKHGVKVCFDPNLRLKLWTIEEARTVILDIAKDADYFLPGLDELKLLYHTESFDEIVKRLRELKAVSVVKGGNDETYVVQQGNVSAVPYFKADRVVDTVGAGDGFCAGFFAGLLKGYSHTEAARLGNLIGCMVVQMEGDWEGIPTWEQVEAVLHNVTHVER